jgi:hypothetical protein
MKQDQRVRYIKVDTTHWSVRVKHMIEGSIVTFILVVLLELFN